MCFISAGAWCGCQLNVKHIIQYIGYNNSLPPPNTVDKNQILLLFTTLFSRFTVCVCYLKQYRKQKRKMERKMLPLRTEIVKIKMMKTKRRFKYEWHH